METKHPRPGGIFSGRTFWCPTESQRVNIVRALFENGFIFKKGDHSEERKRGVKTQQWGGVLFPGEGRGGYQGRDKRTPRGPEDEQEASSKLK